jgi:hypothetical protein
LERSRTWGELAFRPLAAPWSEALELFGFAGASAPAPAGVEAGWGAWDGSRLVGALLFERSSPAALLHGPVMVAPPTASPEAVLDAAERLLTEALAHAGRAAIATIFTRPQGLDRLWVRAGFIPVPEAELPGALRGRPGVGLFGWRGGTALWSTASRGAPRNNSIASDR